MSILGVVMKQPAEVIDFDIDYSEYFLQLSGGDTISTVTAVISSGNDGGGDDLVLGPGGLPETVLVGDDKGKVWIGAGVDGVTYKITVTMTSTAARVREHDVRIIVKEF
ncbi:MAG: hypothetical protein KBF48_12995 [Xanthomonadales bacterium]|nr:hypothetical protein [Xanthomonadales bacterium]